LAKAPKPRAAAIMFTGMDCDCLLELSSEGYPSGFPAVAPLNETPREIQLSVRVVF
jgi:hypothetical protein